MRWICYWTISISRAECWPIARGCLVVTSTRVGLPITGLRNHTNPYCISFAILSRSVPQHCASFLHVEIIYDKSWINNVMTHNFSENSVDGCTSFFYSWSVFNAEMRFRIALQNIVVFYGIDSETLLTIVLIWNWNCFMITLIVSTIMFCGLPRFMIVSLKICYDSFRLADDARVPDSIAFTICQWFISSNR